MQAHRMHPVLAVRLMQGKWTVKMQRGSLSGILHHAWICSLHGCDTARFGISFLPVALDETIWKKLYQQMIHLCSIYIID